MDTYEQHRGHRIHPHDHSWQVRVWGFTARCSGDWLCLSCWRWFKGEVKCWRAAPVDPDSPAPIGRAYRA